MLALLKDNLRKKRWKRKTKDAVTNFIQNFASTTNTIYKHITLLSIEDVTAIASVCHDDIDLSEEAYHLK